MDNQDNLPATTFFYPSSAAAIMVKHEQVIAIATALLESKQIKPIEQYSEIIEDEEMYWMSYSIELDQTLDEIVELNFELALRLADLPSESLKNVMVKFIKVKLRGEGDATSK